MMKYVSQFNNKRQADRSNRGIARKRPDHRFPVGFREEDFKIDSCFGGDFHRVVENFTIGLKIGRRIQEGAACMPDTNVNGPREALKSS